MSKIGENVINWGKCQKLEKMSKIGENVKNWVRLVFSQKFDVSVTFPLSQALCQLGFPTRYSSAK